MRARLKADGDAFPVPVNTVLRPLPTDVKIIVQAGGKVKPPRIRLAAARIRWGGMEVIAMANCKNRISRAEARLRAAAAAAAEAVQAETPMEEDVPMSRYVNPLPAAPAPVRDWSGQTALLEQLLEQTCRQNQILLDLLSAVNGLAGAVLVRSGRAEN